jgi:predicted nucleotidyltransferase
MISQEQVKQQLRDNYAFLSTEYGVTKIGLFGSYAKGTADEESDIDLVVEFERPLGFKFIEMIEYLEQLLGKKVEVLTLTGIEDIRIPQVAQEIKASIIYV